VLHRQLHLAGRRIGRSLPEAVVSRSWDFCIIGEKKLHTCVNIKITNTRKPQARFQHGKDKQFFAIRFMHASHHPLLPTPSHHDSISIKEAPSPSNLPGNEAPRDDEH
jgi:hypothetical protein